jgi:hypothetical protein
MAALVAGAVTGVHKKASIVPVKVSDADGTYYLNYLVSAFKSIQVVQAANGNKDCVINITMG